ncbi:MAG TPA: putative O-glycosylation ligase, exosortase A system-associated [Steroidobacteraceae bacterium]|nr:putative O-glycosylation ligase, exosortase A system-associated [Steroidobacteraceae bacterium]HRX88942.1 putative O-glycosylation ligase, exosortase A system-associated [Steroidobacteraceae bacterium]
MRDIVLVLIVMGSLPIILMRPWVGIIMWNWLGFMNPHRFTWGFAYDFPFSALVALATLAGLLFTRDRRMLVNSSVLWVWVIWIVWMNITTFFALIPQDAVMQWDKVMKIQFFALLAMVLVYKPEHIKILVWVITGSLAFYGIKGGFFAIETGGGERVYGPRGSFFEDNNAMGLVLVMTVPLLRFVQLQLKDKWARLALLGSILLTLLAAFATFSRGALLAALAVLGMLAMRGRQRIALAAVMILLVPILIVSMPDKWMARMLSIDDYQSDGSAMGRINAWWFAFNLAKDHVFGGGFETFDPQLFMRYAPNPTDFHDAHSIYFEVLGEHGFIGLALFLMLGALTLLTAQNVVSRVRNAPAAKEKELHWCFDLASMIQVSLIGYAIGGAFLGLAYFDLFYGLIAILLIVKRYVDETLAAPAVAREPAVETTAASADAAPEPLSAFTADGRPNPYALLGHQADQGARRHR